MVFSDQLETQEEKRLRWAHLAETPAGQEVRGRLWVTEPRTPVTVAIKHQKYVVSNCFKNNNPLGSLEKVKF
jgi:hypothetical protein